MIKIFFHWYQVEISLETKLAISQFRVFLFRGSLKLISDNVMWIPEVTIRLSVRLHIHIQHTQRNLPTKREVFMYFLRRKFALQAVFFLSITWP